MMCPLAKHQFMRRLVEVRMLFGLLSVILETLHLIANFCLCKWIRECDLKQSYILKKEEEKTKMHLEHILSPETFL